RQGYPFAGCGQGFLVALTPAAAGLPAVADRPVQRGETAPLAGQGRRQLRRRRLRVLIELDRIRGAHIEPEPPGQRRTGRITLSRVDLHISLAPSDRPELAPVALLARIPLPHDARHDRFLSLMDA